MVKIRHLGDLFKKIGGIPCTFKPFSRNQNQESPTANKNENKATLNTKSDFPKYSGLFFDTSSNLKPTEFISWFAIDEHIMFKVEGTTIIQKLFLKF